MRLSVVLPLFNEAENLEQLYTRLTVTLDRIACDYELIFVNDGCTDGSPHILEQLADQDARVKFLSLSRNFGHEIASTAGLDAADGDAVILMDADLQDPPELIERLLEPWLQGYDIVYGRRLMRHGESWFKRAAAFLFYRMMRRFSSLDLPLDAGDFRLMDRRVIEAFRKFPESQRFVRGLVTWMGFRQTAVDYERQARHAGVGKYSIWQLLKLGTDALLSFSVLPLRLATLLGFLCVIGALAGAAAVIGGHWFLGSTIGSSSLTNFLLMLFSGVQLVAIGILGEYVGRMHRDVLGRPLYLLDRRRGWEDDRIQRRLSRVESKNSSSLPSESSARQAAA
jgi:dolichol-phosphate mannosyltransferase